MLWLSPDVQYAHYVKGDDQKDAQNDAQDDDQEDDSVYDSEHDWPLFAALSIHDVAHKSSHKEAHWYESLRKVGMSVLICNLSSRPYTDLYYSPQLRSYIYRQNPQSS